MRTFLISDTHFFHSNVLTFLRDDGTLLRPGFKDIEHMNEVLIENWNKVVSPGDKVYHLGDVAFKQAAGLRIFDALNGDKVLIKGNHDLQKLSTYQSYFRDVRGSHQLDKFILTHIPIHPNSLSRWKGNIHGHLHDRHVTLPDGTADNRYCCVSVEQINYTPIDFEEIRARYAA